VRDTDRTLRDGLNFFLVCRNRRKFTKFPFLNVCPTVNFTLLLVKFLEAAAEGTSDVTFQKKNVTFGMITGLSQEIQRRNTSVGFMLKQTRRQ